MLFATKALNSSSVSISATAFVHAVLFLFPAVAIALPRPSPRGFGNGVFTGFSVVFNTWIALGLVVLQFYPQYLEFKRMSGLPGSLSLLSLGLRAIVMLAVAVRWFLRLGAPTWGCQLAPLTLWYQWGWLPINYVIYGIGCAVLVGLYLQVGLSDEAGLRVGERAPLLVV